MIRDLIDEALAELDEPSFAKGYPWVVTTVVIHPDGTFSPTPCRCESLEGALAWAKMMVAASDVASAVISYDDGS